MAARAGYEGMTRFSWRGNQKNMSVLTEPCSPCWLRLVAWAYSESIDACFPMHAQRASSVTCLWSSIVEFLTVVLLLHSGRSSGAGLVAIAREWPFGLSSTPPDAIDNPVCKSSTAFAAMSGSILP